MPKVHVKKDDTVYILSGRDRGKTGKVLEVDTKNNKVKVDGVNIVKKHKKPRPPKDAEGGIKEEPAFIHASNVKLTDAKGKSAKPKAKAKASTKAKAEKAAPAEKADKAAPEKKAKAKSKAKEK